MSSDGVAGPVDGAAQPSGASWGLPLVVLIVGTFMSTLNTNIVNVAIPTIQNEFGALIDDMQWVVTAYTLTLGVVIPASAWLGDRFGLSRVYSLALLGFAAGSALCGLAWDLNGLVAFRIVQAIPGGILPVITLSILYRIVPRNRLGGAIGTYSLGVMVAPAVGPTLGGYLAEYADWRLIFFINVPVAILGAVATALVMPAFPGRAGQRFDMLGFVTVSGGLFALLLVLSEKQDWGWGSYRTLGLITFSVLSLALFVVIELKIADPLLDLRVFRHWAFTHSLLLIALLSTVLFGVQFYIPQFLQQAQELGALDAGLVLLPRTLVMAVLMPIAGWVYDRIGPRWPVTVGLTIATVGTYLLHTLTLDTSRERVMWLLVVQAAGLGMAITPIFSASIAVIPMAYYANAANTFNNVARNVGGALGLAVLTTILTSQQAQQTARRAALLPAGIPITHLGPPGTQDGAGLHAISEQTQQQVLVTALDNLFLIIAALCALCALGGLLLPSGRLRGPGQTRLTEAGNTARDVRQHRTSRG